MKPYWRQGVWSRLGKVLASGSGIEELMEDLGIALAEGGPELCFLGGGNPAHVPAAEAIWQREMAEISRNHFQLRRVLGIYDPPRGNPAFLQAFANFLNRLYGWEIGTDQLAVTPGGQMAFFLLFCLLAGDGQGERGQIVFPVIPEYIGYAAQELGRGIFVGLRPQIEITGTHSFRYRADFAKLEDLEGIVAVCISQPTNPSGNLLSEEELRKLSDFAKRKGALFLIDHAYGKPFPGIVFRESTPLLEEHHVLVFSLSKLGLPGVRTAVVLGPSEVTQALSRMVANLGLANGNLGQAILRPLLESGELVELVTKRICEFYRKRMLAAREWVDEFFPADLPYFFHETDGSMFLWLWLQDLPISSKDFYQRLKRLGVLVVPGEYFFYGLGSESFSWRHQLECVRISYAMDEEQVCKGLNIIGKEIRRVYG
ncbi:MAG: valine--pyruvate transaminase [Chthoniobacterales bacterium]|nr:valine--pyruvate transaminase [Chthoniobacterales bacterium]